MEQVSLPERVWLNSFRFDHPHVHINYVRRKWVVTVPLPDGEGTRKFDQLADVRAWLTGWAGLGADDDADH